MTESIAASEDGDVVGRCRGRAVSSRRRPSRAPQASGVASRTSSNVRHSREPVFQHGALQQRVSGRCATAEGRLGRQSGIVLAPSRGALLLPELVEPLVERCAQSPDRTGSRWPGLARSPRPRPRAAAPGGERAVAGHRVDCVSATADDARDERHVVALEPERDTRDHPSARGAGERRHQRVQETRIGSRMSSSVRRVALEHPQYSSCVERLPRTCLGSSRSRSCRCRASARSDARSRSHVWRQPEAQRRVRRKRCDALGVARSIAIHLLSIARARPWMVYRNVARRSLVERVLDGRRTSAMPTIESSLRLWPR